MGIILGLVAALLGFVTTGVIVDLLLWDYFADGRVAWLPLVGTPLFAGLTWSFYVILKKLVTPSKKKVENTPLDSDLHIK